MDPIALIFFIVECYHVVGHCVVFFGIRLLPRKDLVRSKLYFVVDTLTVLLVTLIYAPWLWWLCIPQMIEHWYLILTWDESKLSKNINTWSALESANTGIPRFSIKLWVLSFGTFFDIACHVTNAIVLSSHLGFAQIAFGIGLCTMLSLKVLYNKKLAWCDPNAVPAWVQKRVGPIDKYVD